MLGSKYAKGLISNSCHFFGLNVNNVQRYQEKQKVF